MGDESGAKRLPNPGPLLAAGAKRVFWPAMVIPPLLAGLLATAVCREWAPWLKEETMETVALVVVAAAMAIVLLRLATARRPFFIWLTVLIAALTCREIHFEGTSAGIYVAFAVLLIAAWLKHPMFEEYFASRTVTTLLAMAFFSYFLAKSLDQHWWKAIPGEPTFERPVEETMEVIGHVFMAILAAVAAKVAPAVAESDSD